MINPTHLPNLPPGTPEMVRQLAWAFAGVLEAIGRAFNVNPRPVVPGMVIFLYVQRTRSRLFRLLANIRAGILPRWRAPGAKRERGERKAPRIRLPGRKYWLSTEIGWFGRGFSGNIQIILNQPENAAIIAASPQAQRLLRPLCHMLGLEIPAISALPKRPRKPRPKPPAKPRRLTRREREAILWYPNSEGKPMKLLPRKLPRD